MQTQDFPSYLMSAEKNHVKKQAFEKIMVHNFYNFLCSNWGFYFSECKGLIMVGRRSQSNLPSCEFSPILRHPATWSLKLPQLFIKILVGQISHCDSGVKWTNETYVFHLKFGKNEKHCDISIKKVN